MPFDCAGIVKSVLLAPAPTSWPDPDVKVTGLAPSNVYVTTKVAAISDAVLVKVTSTSLLLPLQLPSAALTVGLKSNVGSPL